MLQVFRQGIGGWFVKAFMGLLILAFLVWGIADVFRNFGSSSAARVGSTVISQETFRRIYTERLQQLNSRLGRGSITPEQARALGLDRQILKELLAEAALDQKAHRLGLGISSNAIAQKIAETPEFRGPGGFNHNYFLQIIGRAGYSEAQYVESERKLILRQQIGRSLAGEILPPKTMRDALHRYESEDRTIEFITLGKNQSGAIPEPTPEQLNAYYEDHKASFRAPEYRKLLIISLTPAALASSVEVTEADIKKLYDSQADRFVTPEKRALDQIIFPNIEEATAASARIAAGLSFDALAAAQKPEIKYSALGTVAKREILDPAIADAAFALPAGKVSAPIAGRFGAVLVRVIKIEPGSQQSLAAVSEMLRKEIVEQRAKRDVLDLHDKIEDERASGATLAEVANKLKVKTLTIDAVDRSGRKPDGLPIEDIPDRVEVLAGAFRTQPGVETDAIDIRSQGGYVWYEVMSIIPSRERTFDEVRSLVEQRWRDEETVKKLTVLAETIRGRVETGESFSKAAPGMAVERREKLTRARPTDGFDANAIKHIFSTGEGKSGVVEAQDGLSQIVYRVTAINVPSTLVGGSDLETTLARGLQNDLLDQYSSRVENDLGISVNEAAIRSLTGADRN